MDIVWYGHYCFRLSQRGKATVVTDPFDAQTVGYKPLQTRADVVTISRETPAQGHVKGLRGVRRVLRAPGEYEIGGVFIWGMDVRKASSSEREMVYVFDYEQLTVAHLGGLRHLPSEETLEVLGPVHVALVPVGGPPHDGLTPAQAADLVAMLEPHIAIPMAYKTPHTPLDLRPLSAFLKALGETNPETQSQLRVSSAAQLPEGTRIVVLEPKV